MTDALETARRRSDHCRPLRSDKAERKKHVAGAIPPPDQAPAGVGGADARTPRNVAAICFMPASIMICRREPTAESCSCGDFVGEDPFYLERADRRREAPPKRIQLSRKRGWRMPENVVKMDRYTTWGNPFTIEAAETVGYYGTDAELRGMCIDAFRKWLAGQFQPDLQPKTRAYILRSIDQLRDKNLACWCPLGQPCHAAVLLGLANATLEASR